LLLGVLHKIPQRHIDVFDMEERIGQRSRTTRLLRALVLLAIAAACSLLLARSMDIVTIQESIGNAKPGFLLLLLALNLLTNALRAARLHLILQSKQSYMKTFHICNIGYLTNSLLPLRAGEFCMAALLAKDQPKGGAAALSKLLVDRLLDLLTIVVFFLGTLLFLIPANHAAQREMNAAVVAVMALVAVFAMLLGGMAMESLLVRQIKTLGQKLGRDTTVLVATLRAGVEGIRSLFRKGVFTPAVLLSLLAWTSGAGMFLTCMLALDLPPSFSCAILAMCFTVIGLITVPLPAGVGTTHGAIVIALTLFGISFGNALYYAIVYHAVTTVMNGILGLIGLKSLHLDFQGVRKLVKAGIGKQG
jgi:glycosyltransferase 2 family protein